MILQSSHPPSDDELPTPTFQQNSPILRLARILQLSVWQNPLFFYNPPVLRDTESSISTPGCEDNNCVAGSWKSKLIMLQTNIHISHGMRNGINAFRLLLFIYLDMHLS